MDGLGLILGHLLGDYVFQNDWMAANKSNPAPAFRTWEEYRADGGAARRAWRRGHVACTVHCLLYTLCVGACAGASLPWWGLAACFLAHWPVDRFRLAGRWMRNVSGQAAFASGPLAPWSVVVVDNTFHLLVLFLLGSVGRG